MKTYTRHEVACILAEFTGDNCACNFNGIDEWLPEMCELLDACPYPVGVVCWEQYLKYREVRATLLPEAKGGNKFMAMNSWGGDGDGIHG